MFSEYDCFIVQYIITIIRVLKEYHLNVLNTRFSINLKANGFKLGYFIDQVLHVNV